MEIVSRSMNQELCEGMTDGTYKKMPPQTAQLFDPQRTYEHKLFLWTYGFEEAPVMVTPDGRKKTPSPKDSSWRDDPRNPRDLRP